VPTAFSGMNQKRIHGRRTGEQEFLTTASTESTERKRRMFLKMTVL
jgi:hypothetical protein